MGKGSKILIIIFSIFAIFMLAIKDYTAFYIMIGFILLFLLSHWHQRKLEKEEKEAKLREEQLEKEHYEMYVKEQEEYSKTHGVIDFKVAGVSYYDKNIKELIDGSYESYDNSDKWEELSNKEIKEMELDHVYEYPETSFIDEEVEFIHEPDNPHDENAVRIDILDETVGHVPKSKNKEVLKIIDKIDFISADVVGGRFKSYDYYSDKVKILDKNYSIRVSIHYLK